MPIRKRRELGHVVGRVRLVILLLTIAATVSAVVSVNVRRTRSVSADSWLKSQAALISIGGRVADANSMVLKVDRPMAIAYETVSVNYIASSLSSDKPDDVQFYDIPAVTLHDGDVDLSAFGLNPSSNEVQYALLGSSRYGSEEFANLTAVEPSIRVVKMVYFSGPFTPRSKVLFLRLRAAISTSFSVLWLHYKIKRTSTVRVSFQSGKLRRSCPTLICLSS